MPAASASRRASKQPATRDVGKEASMAAAADALQICRSHQAEGQARCACRQVCRTAQPRPSLVGKFRPSWGIASGPASRCQGPRRHQVRAPRGLLCRARRRNPAGSAINLLPRCHAAGNRTSLLVHPESHNQHAREATAKGRQPTGTMRCPWSSPPMGHQRQQRRPAEDPRVERGSPWAVAAAVVCGRSTE